MSSYREQFFEWVDKQPVYQAMTLQTKEMALHLVDCWLNNNYAYLSNTRLDGKDFAKRCAIDFCWFIRNRTISDLEAKLAERTEQLKIALKDFDDIQQENDKLEQQLAEKDQAIESLKEINQSLGQTCNNDAKEIERLREKLAEKDELLKQKICDMKSTDFIRMCIDCGFMVKEKEIDNQTAIRELEKVKKEINLRPVIVRNCGYGDFEEILLEDVYDVIDNQINELKGKVEDEW